MLLTTVFSDLYIYIYIYKVKVKVIPLQVRCGQEGR